MPKLPGFLQPMMDTILVAGAVGCLAFSSSAIASCLSVGKVHLGGISTESAQIKNNCNTKVSFTYCVTSPNGGGMFSCGRQKFGSDDVGPGRTTGVSVMSADKPLTLHWVECQATPQDRHPMAVRGRWDGRRVHAECR